jgi:type IV pilus assembly protein PilB
MNGAETFTNTLAQFNLISDDVVQQIHSSNEKLSPAQVADFIVSKNIVSGEKLRATLSQAFGSPEIDVNSIDHDFLPTEHIDFELAKKHRVLPVYLHNNHLFVAILDPVNTTAIEEIQFKTKLPVTTLQADPAGLLRIISEAEASAEENALDGLDEDGDLDEFGDLDVVDEDAEDNDSGIDLDEAPIVKYVNKLLLDAIRQEASDIHIEPFEKKLRIRFRADGVLRTVANQPIALAPKMAARIKILSKMDIAERRIPQDGRMKIRISKSKQIDFRVNTLPTMFGEKIVIRVLAMGNEGLTLDMLGFTKEQLNHYKTAVEQPYGMVLITGPTGSGKTVSLYTALNMLNTPEINISTAEDPVEINVEGINQVNINDKQGLDFASALRAFLRQDPDIIMVGEIRDLETANIAIKASQTGHLVLSTLHTNDAPATLTRLLNMGVPAFNIASAVTVIVAQRLGRRLCKNCKEPADIPPEALINLGVKQEEIEEFKPFKPVGCSMCSEGYKGRVGIFQVLPITEEIKALIMGGCTQLDIEKLAEKQGVLDLRQAGLLKVKEGVTSLEEVERVTNG